MKIDCATLKRQEDGEMERKLIMELRLQKNIIGNIVDYQEIDTFGVKER